MLSKVLSISAVILLLTLTLYLIASFSSQNSLLDGIPVFADHGQEITLTLHNSSFGSLTRGGGNQVSVFTSYKVNDNSIVGQTINAVMEVYAPNGTLVRTSSYANGFIAESSGGVEGLETTIKDSTIQSVTANVTFRNLNKTEVLSNDLRVDLKLAEEGTPLATTGEDVAIEEEALGAESEQEQDPSPPQQPDQEENGGEQTIPLPLFG